MTSICGICGEVSYCMYCSGEGCDNCDPVCSCLEQIEITNKVTNHSCIKPLQVVELSVPQASCAKK